MSDPVTFKVDGRPIGEKQLIVLDGPPLEWRLPHDMTALAVSIGVFDGVHRGHQSLLSLLVREAATEGLTPAVATFDPHPLAVLDPPRAPRKLTSVRHRIQILERMRVGVVGVMPFREIRHMEADEFISTVLLDRLRAGMVLVGENFQFGRGGRGSPETLRRAGDQHGFAVKVVGLFTDLEESHPGGVPITSSRIRRCVSEGKTAEAWKLLGRPFELRGEVIEGERRGRDLGIPTANLDIPADMSVPANGIYAAWAEVDGEVHRAALNIGVRPTFGAGRLLTEAHLLDFSGDLYGKQMRLRFVGDRIRPELAYSSVKDLMEQVEIDIADVRRILDETPLGEGIG